ncbi:low molecular weight phosphatase family protein [Sphaerisporangium siamense]|uniref:Protein-tyrosine phosphatase n=1 Tax=Sphaerisporangium siamense TaxID=795645 RepID=A0A7W7DCQ8_9ACTN|nr:protein tyrosine phosphatase [Sphaerisporangium siamense]MBB4702978.1 protein-tyrosine phosphatase [Sphaerisporangium siamense]GII83262.1 low molecular weight phosphatase family protein [Sphaerisporangium siamense]
MAARPDPWTPAPREEGFRLLFVCTANICRSPIAERYARAALGAGSPVVVESAGVRAVPGRPMAPGAARVLEKMGADPSGFAARRLTSRMLEEADLVLTATTAHRGSVVQECPRISRRVFTITEFGALTGAVLTRPRSAADLAREGDPVRRAHVLLAQARALRGLVPVDEPDVPDPYGRWARAYRSAARRIAEGLSAPLETLTAVAAPASAGGRGTSSGW